jgi:hypothetical protein
VGVVEGDGSMKLWRVYNGWTGNGPMNVLVVAATHERALDLARAQFKGEVDKDLEESRQRDLEYQRRFGWKAREIKPKYPDTYWTQLEAVLLCDNLVSEWANKVED